MKSTEWIFADIDEIIDLQYTTEREEENARKKDNKVGFDNAGSSADYD